MNSSYLSIDETMNRILSKSYTIKSAINSSAMCSVESHFLDSAGKGINIHLCRVKRGLHFVQK